MQTFTNIISTAFFAFTILSTGAGAMPLQDTATENSIVARTDAVCTGRYSYTDNDWVVTIPGDDRFDGSNCGSGFLDNLRGQCGVITNWGCDRRGGVDATLTFMTTIGCTHRQVSEAINAASGGVYTELCG